jgi:hypothetical protein
VIAVGLGRPDVLRDHVGQESVALLAFRKRFGGIELFSHIRAWLSVDVDAIHSSCVHMIGKQVATTERE